MLTFLSKAKMASFIITLVMLFHIIGLPLLSVAIRTNANANSFTGSTVRLQQLGFVSPLVKGSSSLSSKLNSRRSGISDQQIKYPNSSTNLKLSLTNKWLSIKNEGKSFKQRLQTKVSSVKNSKFASIVVMASLLASISLRALPANAASFAVVDDVASVVNNFYVTMPYTSSFVTCGLKGSFADILAQVKSKSDGEYNLNIKRNAAYILYGGIYLGCVLHFVYGVIYPKLFGTGMELSTVAGQVIFDNFFMSPFLTFPLAYVVKSVIMGETIRSGVRRYINDVKDRGLLLKAWALWVPVQSITFSIVPDYLRVAFMAFVSFFWLILLSSVESAGDSNVEECHFTDGLTCEFDIDDLKHDNMAPQTTVERVLASKS